MPLPLRILFGSLIGCCAILLCGGGASADYLGGHWGQNHYYYAKALHGYTGYADPVDNAATGWTNNTQFDMILTGSTTTADTVVNVDDYGATDWLGMGVPGPNLDSGVYLYATVKVNAGWLNTRHFNCSTPGAASCDYNADSNPERKCVVSHELGHTIGLAHTTAVPPLTIMHPNHGSRCHSWGLTGPTTRDIGDVNALY